MVVRDDTTTIARPRAPRGLYALWIWLQSLTLALVAPTLVLAAVRLDRRALLLVLGIAVVGVAFMGIDARIWPGMGETLFSAEGRFDAVEIPLSAVRDITVRERWARDGLHLVIAPYAPGIEKLAEGYAVCFNAPDDEGRDPSYGIHMFSNDDPAELRALLGRESTG